MGRESSGAHFIPDEKDARFQPQREDFSAAKPIERPPARDPREIDPEELKKAHVSGEGKFYSGLRDITPSQEGIRLDTDISVTQTVAKDGEEILNTEEVNDSGVRTLSKDRLFETAPVVVTPVDALDAVSYPVEDSETVPHFEDVMLADREDRPLQEAYTRGLIDELRAQYPSLNELFANDERRVDAVTQKFVEMLRARLKISKDSNLHEIVAGLRKALLGPLTEKFRNEDIVKRAKIETQAYRKRNEDVYKGNNSRAQSW